MDRYDSTIRVMQLMVLRCTTSLPVIWALVEVEKVKVIMEQTSRVKLEQNYRTIFTSRPHVYFSMRHIFTLSFLLRFVSFNYVFFLSFVDRIGLGMNIDVVKTSYGIR